MRDSVLGIGAMGVTLAGVVAVGAGFLLNQPILLAGGGALFGVGFVLGGIDSVIHGRATIGGRRRRRETFTGMRGRLVGLFNILLGIIVVGGSFLVLRSSTNPSVAASFEELTRSDLGISIAMIGLGLFFAFWSILRVLGSDQDNSSTGTFLLTLPLRLISLVMVLVGVGMIVFGFARIVAPQWIEVAAAALGIPTLLQ